MALKIEKLEKWMNMQIKDFTKYLEKVNKLYKNYELKEEKLINNILRESSSSDS
jgi:hypothetical protein